MLQRLPADKPSSAGDEAACDDAADLHAITQREA